MVSCRLVSYGHRKKQGSTRSMLVWFSVSRCSENSEMALLLMLLPPCYIPVFRHTERTICSNCMTVRLLRNSMMNEENPSAPTNAMLKTKRPTKCKSTTNKSHGVVSTRSDKSHQQLWQPATSHARHGREQYPLRQQY